MQAIIARGAFMRRLEKEMKAWNIGVNNRIDRFIAILLAALLCGAAPGIGQQSSVPARPAIPATPLPDAPRPVEHPATKGPWELALASGAQQPDEAEQQAPQKPVGTAAAPPEGAPGITASRPAGAVIAPAKQRRARAIFIRVGLLVGAGVALGTVFVLTHATPSQPPQ